MIVAFPCYLQSYQEKMSYFSCSHYDTSSPFWKGDCCKQKEFAPNGSKFFPFSDPFREWDINHLTALPHFKVYLFPFIHLQDVNDKLRMRIHSLINIFAVGSEGVNILPILVAKS